VPGIHTFLVSLALRVVHLLPRRAHEALDAWSRRVARERALQRQRGIKSKSRD
jgi:hypothetical protein